MRDREHVCRRSHSSSSFASEAVLADVCSGSSEQSFIDKKPKENDRPRHQRNDRLTIAFVVHFETFSILCPLWSRRAGWLAGWLAGGRPPKSHSLDLGPTTKTTNSLRKTQFSPASLAAVFAVFRSSRATYTCYCWVFSNRLLALVGVSNTSVNMLQ